MWTPFRGSARRHVRPKDIVSARNDHQSGLLYHFRRHTGQCGDSLSEITSADQKFQGLIPICIIRALAGLGSAIAAPASFGIVGVTFHTEPTRTIAFAILAMGNPIGATTGPILGGAVAVQAGSGWRHLFYIFAGITALPLVIGVLVIPRDVTKRSANRRLDWVGGTMISTSVLLFVFSCTQSGVATRGWREPCESHLVSRPFISGGRVESRAQTSLHSWSSPSYSSSYSFFGSFMSKPEPPSRL